MKIQRFEIPGLAQYSYVISADGKAVVIDPIRDVDRYTAYSEEQGLRIVAVIETHIHADFASGATALAEETGAELALSSYDEGQQYRYTMPHRSLHDGDTIDVGQLQFRALFTPGHTPEHLSFLLSDLQRSSSEPVALFSGDFLFVGSLGRPDLLGEEEKKHLAHDLFVSLTERIRSLPDGVQLYPGHGAGSLCGAGMSERPESTLGYERATNPLFALKEPDFVKEVLGSVPPMPLYYPRMKELNSKGASPLPTIPGNTPISAARLAQLVDEQHVMVLDLRRPEAFGGAHITGAVNIGAGQNLSLWAGWLLDASTPIVLVNDSGDDELSRRALVRVGMDHIAGFLAQGMPAWIDAGLPFTRISQLSTDEAEQNSGGAQILDVRNDNEWYSGHIRSAMHISLGDLPSRSGELPKNSAIITVCGSGYRSSIAASLLAARGFESVASMDGGMTAWNRRTLPIVTP